jgi:hypothetical protein
MKEILLWMEGCFVGFLCVLEHICIGLVHRKVSHGKFTSSENMYYN